jgi:excisionase family DNA binding protein
MLKRAVRTPELMTVKEVAAEWRLHPGTVYRLIAAGVVPSVRVGVGRGALRVPRGELYEDARARGGGGTSVPAERDGPDVSPAVEPSQHGGKAAA